MLNMLWLRELSAFMAVKAVVRFASPMPRSASISSGVVALWLVRPSTQTPLAGVYRTRSPSLWWIDGFKRSTTRS